MVNDQLTGVLEHTVIGRHYGKAFWAKVSGYPVRCAELHKFLKPQGIDVAISQSSFHSPVVARWLGVPSIYVEREDGKFKRKPDVAIVVDVTFAADAPGVLGVARAVRVDRIAVDRAHDPPAEEGETEDHCGCDDEAEEPGAGAHASW